MLGYRGKGGTLAFLPRHWVHFIFKLNFNHKITNISILPLLERSLENLTTSLSVVVVRV